MRLDWGGIDLDRLRPPTLSLVRLRFARTRPRKSLWPLVHSLGGQRMKGHTFVDKHLFGKLERLRRVSSQYSYPRVKRPILAWLARRMMNAGTTREPRSDAMLASILAMLEKLESGRRLVC